jgi:hypothetical protein
MPPPEVVLTTTFLLLGSTLPRPSTTHFTAFAATLYPPANVVLSKFNVLVRVIPPALPTWIRYMRGLSGIVVGASCAPAPAPPPAAARARCVGVRRSSRSLPPLVEVVVVVVAFVAETRRRRRRRSGVRLFPSEERRWKFAKGKDEGLQRPKALHPPRGCSTASLRLPLPPPRSYPLTGGDARQW